MTYLRLVRIWTVVFTAAMVVTFFAESVSAQNASVQVIHNSSDAALRTVDIWIGNVRAMDNVVYRSATPFRSFPVGTNTLFEVRVCAANSVDTINPFFFGRATLVANGRYIIIASGLLNGSSPNNRFTITTRANANVTSNVPGAVFLAPFNGLAGSASSSWYYPHNNRRAISRLDENNFGNNTAIRPPFPRLVFQIPGRNLLYTSDVDFSSLVDSAAVGMLSGILDEQSTGTVTEEEFILVTPRGRVLRYPLRLYAGSFFQVINQCLDTASNQFTLRLGNTLIRDTLSVGNALPMQEGSGVLYLLASGAGGVLDSITLPTTAGRYVIVISGGRSTAAVGNDGAAIPLKLKWLTSFPIANPSPDLTSFTTTLEVREQTPSWIDVVEGLPTAKSDVFFRNGRRLSGLREVKQSNTPSGLYLIWKKRLGVEQGQGALLPLNSMPDSMVTVSFHERILPNGGASIRARVYYLSGRKEDRTLNPFTGYWRWVNNLWSQGQDSIALSAVNHIGNTAASFDEGRKPGLLSAYRLNSLGDSTTFRLNPSLANSRLASRLERFGSSPLESVVVVSGDTARQISAINVITMSHRYPGFQLDDSLSLNIVNGITDGGTVRLVLGFQGDTIARLNFGQVQPAKTLRADETFLDLVAEGGRSIRRFRMPLWQIPDFERNALLILRGSLADTGSYCTPYLMTGLGRKLVLEELPLSVKSREIARPLVIYPNPALPATTITLSGIPSGEAEILLIDALGRVVSSQHVHSIEHGIVALKLPQISAGCYQVCVRSTSGSQSKRLVIR